MYQVMTGKTCKGCGALQNEGEACPNCSRPEEPKEARGMTGEDCVKIVAQLSRSQGFYGRMLRSIAELREYDKEQYQELMDYWTGKHYSDVVDFIMDLEG